MDITSEMDIFRMWHYISHLQHLLSINSLCDQSVVSIAEAICAISVLLDLNGNLPRISLAA